MIGDVAGHIDQLHAELGRLGVVDNVLPPDLTVIQVGDLVHRGPHSDAVVELVDSYLSRQPDQWIQLIGNHEAQYVHRPVFAWPQKLDRWSVKAMRRWEAEGTMRVAASFLSEGRSYLVTHAGLAEPFWRQIIDAPPTSSDAAEALNALARNDVVFAPGKMLNRVNPTVGPVWTDSASELVPGWRAARAMPFSQIYGHSTITDWVDPVAPPSSLHDVLTIDHVFKHEQIRIGDQKLVGIDPGHQAFPSLPWRSLVLEGKVEV